MVAILVFGEENIVKTHELGFEISRLSKFPPEDSTRKNGTENGNRIDLSSFLTDPV